MQRVKLVNDDIDVSQVAYAKENAESHISPLQIDRPPYSEN